jgi:hypothetical protein
MTQTPSGTRPPQQPPYEHSAKQSQKFLDALAGVPWQPYEAYNLLVLQARCPECGAEDGISVAVPTVGTLPFLSTYTGTGPSSAYVECTCDENHGAPPGEKGCGRWALITPRLADISLDDDALAEVLAAAAPAPAEPAAAEPVAEEGKSGKPAAEKGADDADSH